MRTHERGVRTWERIERRRDQQKLLSVNGLITMLSFKSWNISVYIRQFLQLAGINHILLIVFNFFDYQDGVPQIFNQMGCSTLGYYSFFPKIMKHSRCLLYADDFKKMCAVSRVSDSVNLQRDSLHNLFLNTAKCKVLTFYRRRGPVKF